MIKIGISFLPLVLLPLAFPKVLNNLKDKVTIYLVHYDGSIVQSWMR